MVTGFQSQNCGEAGLSSPICHTADFCSFLLEALYGSIQGSFIIGRQNNPVSNSLHFDIVFMGPHFLLLQLTSRDASMIAGQMNILDDLLLIQIGPLSRNAVRVEPDAANTEATKTITAVSKAKT